MFDRYEKNPEKAHPIEPERVRLRLPRRPMGLYQSTELDTTERRVPWYYYAAMALLVFVVAMTVVMSGKVRAQFAKPDAAKVRGGGHGAPATGPTTATRFTSSKPTVATADDYGARFTPLVEGVAWSAPAWANDQVRSEPHYYCIASGRTARKGATATEQGTHVRMDLAQCWTLARYGEPYNPFKAPERAQERHQPDQAPGAAGGAPRRLAGADAGDPVLVQPQGAFARSEPVMPAQDAHF